MRLRFAIISTVVIVLGACGVVWHQRARAEHVRLALYQADESKSARAEAAEKTPTAAPPASGLPGAVVAEAAPAAAEPSTTPALLPPVPNAAVGGVAPLAPAIIAAPGVAPANVTVHAASPHPYGQPGTMPYLGAPGGADPEANELTSQDQQFEQEVQSLVRQLAVADDEKTKADPKEKLAAALERQFDTQQKLRQLEISRIEARVQKLRGLLDKRTESRRKIVDNRLEQLLNDAEGLGWSSGTTSGVQYVPHTIHGGWGSPNPAAPLSPPPATVPAPRRR